MDDIFELRRYYNTRIHPELLRLDKKRKVLLWLSFFTLLIFIAVSIFALTSGILAIVLFLWIPAFLAGAFLLFRIRKFKSTFKPPVVRLILEYLKLDISYTPGGKVSREHFISSGLFAPDPGYYHGEDFFLGMIEGVQFEMSELDVRAPSASSGKLEPLFRGVFFKAKIAEPFQGKVLILPKTEKPYLMRTIKAIGRQGGKKIQAGTREFEKIFLTYADPQVESRSFLSIEFCNSILKYREKTGREIYISFAGSHFYLAIKEPRDLLEPSIFRSVVNFKLIREFYEDIRDITTIIRDFNLYR